MFRLPKDFLLNLFIISVPLVYLIDFSIQIVKSKYDIKFQVTKKKKIDDPKYLENEEKINKLEEKINTLQEKPSEDSK